MLRPCSKTLENTCTTVLPCITSRILACQAVLACVYICACMRACVHVCVRACVCVYIRAPLGGGGGGGERGAHPSCAMPWLSTWVIVPHNSLAFPVFAICFTFAFYLPYCHIQLITFSCRAQHGPGGGGVGVGRGWH